MAERSNMAERYLKVCEEYTGTWRFMPKRKNGSVTIDDIEREMFDMGLEGCLYGVIFKIPCEFPADNREYIEVLEPEQIVKSVCQWLHWKVFDENGEEVDLSEL